MATPDDLRAAARRVTELEDALERARDARAHLALELKRDGYSPPELSRRLGLPLPRVYGWLTVGRNLERYGRGGTR
jgi:hypothetical protein